MNSYIIKGSCSSFLIEIRTANQRTAENCRKTNYWSSFCSRHYVWWCISWRGPGEQPGALSAWQNVHLPVGLWLSLDATAAADCEYFISW